MLVPGPASVLSSNFIIGYPVAALMKEGTPFVAVPLRAITTMFEVNTFALNLNLKLLVVLLLVAEVVKGSSS